MFKYKPESSPSRIEKENRGFGVALLSSDLRVDDLVLLGRPLLVRVGSDELGPLFDECASLSDVLALLFSKFV